MHHSWALVQVAKIFLDDPGAHHDCYDLPAKANVSSGVLDKLLPRMAGQGWLATDDGWSFRLTTKGHRALAKLLYQTHALRKRRPADTTPRLDHRQGGGA